MNEKNIKALLKSLGISETVITESEKDDFDVKAAVATFNESQKAHYTDIIKNEVRPEIEAEVTKDVEGKLYSTLRNDIKKNFGVPTDKLKDLFPHDMLKVAKTHIEEVYSKNPNAEEIKKLQEEKMEWQNKSTELEQSIAAKIEAANKEADRRVVSKLTDLAFTKTFHGIPADKIVGGHSDVMLWGLKAYMGNKYDWGLDDKEESVPYEKGTSKRVTLKDASGKEYFATASELMLNSLKETKGLKESNGGEGSGNGGKGGNGNGNGQEKSAHLKALEERAMKAVA